MAISERATRQILTGAATPRGGGMLITDPACPPARRDAYKQAWLNIRFAMLSAPGPALLVSAVDETAAAAPLAANLAILAAQEGERVILLDANPHEPSLENLFTLSTRPGFSTLIRHDGGDVESALQDVDLPGVSSLRLLGAGDDSIPGGLGRAHALGAVLGQLKLRADRLLLIGTPVLTHVDSMDLCPLVDGVVITMTPGKTHREDAARARQVLDRVHAPLLGVVLTQSI